MSTEVVPELSVVLPAHDEEESIARVIESWSAELTRLGLDFELLVLDDGSRDRTGEIVAGLAGREPRVHLLAHPNCGHGPTIMRGYRAARGRWVAQSDGDGEVPASAFAALWERRHGADLVLGRRVGRASPLGRRLLSAGARFVLRQWFGARLADPNCPFRLFGASALRQLLTELPDSLFAPNVALAGLAVREGLAVVEVPVPFAGRSAGRSSLVSAKLLGIAWRTLGETVSVARQRLRR